MKVLGWILFLNHLLGWHLMPLRPNRHPFSKRLTWLRPLSFRHYTSAKGWQAPAVHRSMTFWRKTGQEWIHPRDPTWIMNSCLYEILGLYLCRPHKWIQTYHSLNKPLACCILLSVNWIFHWSQDRLCFSTSTGAFQSWILNHFKTIPGGQEGLQPLIPSQKVDFGPIFTSQHTFPEGRLFSPNPSSVDWASHASQQS